MRSRGAGVEAACTNLDELGVRPVVAVVAEGDVVLALGGNEAAPVLLRSDDGGARCDRIALPSLAVRDAQRGGLGLSFVGTIACAWSTAGASIRSDDAGRSWRRLPTLAALSHVAAGPRGATLAAVPLDVAGSAQRVRLDALATGAAVWRSIDGATSLREPVAVAAPTDEGVLVVHAHGALQLDGALALRTLRRDVSMRYVTPASMLWGPAGSDAVVSVVNGVVSRWTADATTPITVVYGDTAAAPRATVIRAFDASREGVLWATDGRTLRQGTFDRAFQPMHEHPLRDASVTHMAVRGTQVLVVGDRGNVAWREGAAPWRTVPLPSDVGTPQAVVLGGLGEALLVGAEGAALAEAFAFVRVPRPSLLAAFPRRAAQVMWRGDHWTFVDTRIQQSDDHGAHWRACDLFELPTMPTFGPSLPAIAGAVAGDEGVLLVADARRHIWRYDDGCSAPREALVVPPHDAPGFRTDGELVLAWDGASRVAALGDRGVTQWRGTDLVAGRDERLPFSVLGAAYVDDVLVAWGRRSRLAPPSCRATGTWVLHVLAVDGWIADPDACSLRAEAMARDGDGLWSVDASLHLRRLSLRRFVREVGGR
jgi:hypothetical protein